MNDPQLASRINSKIDAIFVQLADVERRKVDDLSRAHEAKSAAARVFVQAMESSGRQAFATLSARIPGRLHKHRDVIRLHDTDGLPHTVQPMKYGPFFRGRPYLHRFGVLSGGSELTSRHGRAEELRGHGRIDVEAWRLPPADATPDASGMYRWYDEAALREEAIAGWMHVSVTESLATIREAGRNLYGISDGASLLLDTDSGRPFIAWNYDGLRGVLVSIRDMNIEDVPRVGVQIATDTWIESIEDYFARAVECELAIDEVRQSQYRR